MSNVVKLNPGYYPNPDKSKAVNGGNLYVGEPDTDPEVVVNQKQISVLQEDGSEVNVSQPLTLSAGGVPEYNGSPVTVLVNGDYSLKVTNSSGAQVYYIPNDESLDTKISLSKSYACDLNAAITDIGATVTTLEVDCSTNLTANATVPSTLNIVVVPPGQIITSTYTLTINGNFDAPPEYQAFDTSGGGSIVGIYNVHVEWWGTDHTALQEAIDASGDSNFGSRVKIGNTTVDITGNTVTMKQGTIIEGILPKWSKISMDGGSLSFGTYYSGNERLKILKNLDITNTLSTGNTVDLGVLDGSNNGPYEALIDNCYIDGGLNAINIDGAVWVTINNSQIRNDGAAIYSLYSNTTAYLNQLNITNSRFDGKFYVDMIGTSVGRTLNINGTIFEGSNSPIVQIVAVGGGSFINSYIESDTNGVLLLDIDQAVQGFYIGGGSNFSVKQNTDEHIHIDGKSVVVESNYFGGIGAQNAITLQSNSAYCVIGTNQDAGGGDGIPVVSDSGTQNRVYGYFFKKRWYGAHDITPVTGAALNTGQDGMPRLEFPDAVDNTAEIMIKLHEDIYIATSVQVHLIYSFDAADVGKNARITVSSEPQNTGSALAALGSSSTTLEEAADTNLNIFQGISDPVATTDEYFAIKILRNGTSGDDDTTSHFYLYGIEVRIRTLGYPD